MAIVMTPMKSDMITKPLKMVSTEPSSEGLPGRKEGRKEGQWPPTGHKKADCSIGVFLGASRIAFEFAKQTEVRAEPSPFLESIIILPYLHFHAVPDPGTNRERGRVRG